MPADLPASGWRARAPLVALLLGFGLSRVIAVRCGLRFDTYPLGHFWQYLDPPLLRDHLLESVWYLHSQPPLFNLLLGVVLKLPFPPPALFAVLYLAIGLGLALTMDALMRRLGAAAWTAAGVTLLFAVSPPALYFEHFLFSEYPTMLLLCTAALALHRFLSTGRRRDGWAAFGLMAAVVLTRSLFQLPWLLAVVAGLALPATPAWRRAIAGAAAPAVIVIAAFCLRNLLLFGTASTSSWFGMNLMSSVDFAWPASERRGLVERGEVGPIVSVPAFSPVGQYRGVVALPPPTGIAVLDVESTESGSPNYNHAAYATVAPLYAHEALRLLASHPARYLHASAAAASLFFRPASDYEYFRDFRQRMPRWDALYRFGLYGQLTAGGPGVAGPAGFPLAVSAPNIGWFILLTTPLLLWLGLCRRRAAARRGDQAAAGTLAFIIVTIVYLMLVGTLLNIGENQRYRFMTEPFLFVLAAVAWSANRRRRRQAPPR
ncbi:MAG: hypothetical protein SF182_08885 [Deltaproteobacteria bacterium]|nr:hypothetical protein [Deltaproteobacteria bacterium]